MLRLAATVVAILLIVSSGVVHGVLTGRWSARAEVQEAAGRLENVPAKFGEWTSEDTTIPERHLEIGEIEGYLARTYTNGVTDGSVNLLIVCGRPGPISVHTPDVCLRGAGFGFAGPIRKHVLMDGEASGGVELFVADFVRDSVAAPEQARVFWTWIGRDTAFVAPDTPRVAFAGDPYLYKLYLTRATVDSNEPVEDDVCLAFLRELSPQLKRALRAEPQEEAAGH